MQHWKRYHKTWASAKDRLYPVSGLLVVQMPMLVMRTGSWPSFLPSDLTQLDSRTLEPSAPSPAHPTCLLRVPPILKITLYSRNRK